MSHVTVEGLSFSIDGAQLLNNISFSLEKGSLTLIAGRNGSGKSMLLKCLKGLEKPQKGVISLDGRPLLKAKERMKAFGLVFQDTFLQIVGSTVKKDIAFGMENLKKERGEVERRTEELLDLFSLRQVENLNPILLSGGERRRLSIAGVLAMEPEVILLDEPLANLDYPSVVLVLNTLLTLKEKGVTVLIVSHEAEKLLALTDRTIILSKGEVVGEGRSEEMMDKLRENDVYLPPSASFRDLSWLK